MGGKLFHPPSPCQNDEMNLRRLLFLVLTVLLALSATAADRRRAFKPASWPDITIGGLFSLTGDGSTLGIASQAALELAAHDINAEFQTLHLPYRVTTVILDTKLTPAIAATQLPELVSRGANFVIGPQSSSEAAAIREYANANNVILISQGSTAGSLALPGDNLFRLAPNDNLEGQAMAALMRADGIDTLLPMYRNDVGNTGLYTSTKKWFESMGGTTLPPVSYSPATTDFTQAVNAFGSELVEYKTAHPTAKIGVYLASFEEAVAIFNRARLDLDLTALRWYGGDGVTQSQAVLADANAAQFAKTTSFTAPNVGLDESNKDVWQPISDEIRDRVGFAADAYSLSVYDAAWVAALSTVEAQFRSDALREAFVRNVQRYWGATGLTALDVNGDRKVGNFDFWTVRDVSGTLQWTRTAQFVSGRLVR